MAVKSEKRAVEQFFATGKLNGWSEEELAAACDRRVRQETQLSASKSIELAKKFVKQSGKHGEIVQLNALRACGWAMLVAGRYKEAEKSYLQARAMVKRDAMMRARIDRVLIDIYMYLGNSKEARRRARLSLNSFSRLGVDIEIAKTRVNYANVLHRQDRHQEASSLYSKAAKLFEKKGNQPALALCWYNLANTKVQLFDFAGALKLYLQARKICVRHEQTLLATGCLYGLAWLHMLEGNFHTALVELTECEEQYRAGGQARETILCQLDRAESYLGLNLFLDARHAAEEAHKGAKKIGINYELAKAALFAGKAMFGLGRLASARTQLNKAELGFRKERNQGFLAATRMTLAQLDRASSGKLRSIRDVRQRLSRAQLPLWEAICDLQILSDAPDDRSALKRLARNRAVKTVPHLNAQRHTILGDRQAKSQRLKAAINHWTQAADILDAVRAKLPPVEMRSAFFNQRSEPHRKLIHSEYGNNPLQAAVWSERYKTVGLWSTSEDFFMTNPARSRVQESLSELADRVTAASGMIADNEGKRSFAMRSPEAFGHLQRQVRQDMASLEQGETSEMTTESIRSLITDLSFKQPIVQFHVGREDIISFTHYRGDTHARLYPEGTKTLGEMMARWRFMIECAPRLSSPIRKTDLEDEQNILASIARWLLPPLELPSGANQMLIVPEGQISSLPWSALSSNGSALGERYELTFVPSLRHHIHAQQQKTRSRKVQIFIGPSDDLPFLKEEISAVRSRLAPKDSDVHDPSRRGDFPDDTQARLWHFSGHAHLRADNPFYSSLLLEDGPLFAADFRTKRNKVGLVTLAACRTGQQTCLPGEESTGLVRSLLEMGARNVVASGWAVSDRSTSEWMDLFYKHYLQGASAPKAVQLAALGVRERYPSAYHWGSFSLFGAG